MTKLLFRPRKGKDLKKFIQLALSSSDRANEWALMNFCYSSKTNENLDIANIANIKNRKPELYLQLVNSVFPFNVSDLPELEVGGCTITYYDKGEIIRISKEEITSDFIESMQAEKSKFKKGDEVNLMFRLAARMFEISEETLLDYPAVLAMQLCNEVNTFLGEITLTRNDFDIEDDLLYNTKQDVKSGMGELVPGSNATIQANKQRAPEIIPMSGLTKLPLKPPGFA